MREVYSLKRPIKRKELEELEESAIYVGNYNLRYFTWYGKDMFMLIDISNLLLIKYQALKFVVDSEAKNLEKQMISVNYKDKEHVGVSSYIVVNCLLLFVLPGTREKFSKLFKEVYRICRLPDIVTF